MGSRQWGLLSRLQCSTGSASQWHKAREAPCSQTAILYIAKMPILPNFIYRLSVIPAGWAFLFLCICVCMDLHLRICFLLILESGEVGEGRERNTDMREKHWSVASCTCPDGNGAATLCHTGQGPSGFLFKSPRDCGTRDRQAEQWNKIECSNRCILKAVKQFCDKKKGFSIWHNWQYLQTLLCA